MTVFIDPLMADFTLPGSTHRTAVLGRTGTGKSILALWLLSHQNFDVMPWVVVDFKREEELAKIGERIMRRLKLSDSIPGNSFRALRRRPTPGLYMINPRPDQGEELDEFFWRVWEHGRCGIFIDEAHMINSRSPAYNALLTQGRSKRIPMISVSQQPKHISTFTLSQADFIVSFPLLRRDDQRVVEEFMPADLREELPQYHSRWFDVKQNKLSILTPVPEPAHILGRIIDRAPRPFWW
jgi:DNA helicase HerA-like ATPase